MKIVIYKNNSQHKSYNKNASCFTKHDFQRYQQFKIKFKCIQIKHKFFSKLNKDAHHAMLNLIIIFGSLQASLRFWTGYVDVAICTQKEKKIPAFSSVNCLVSSRLICTVHSEKGERDAMLPSTAFVQPVHCHPRKKTVHFLGLKLARASFTSLPHAGFPLFDRGNEPLDGGNRNWGGSPTRNRDATISSRRSKVKKM